MTVGSSVADARARVVLIVDDDRDNRELVEIILKSEGFTTVTAASGKEALACVATRAPDLILLDVMMPNMNGYEVTTELKGAATTKNIPIVILTALNDSASRALATKVGAADLLSKPFGIEELCACVWKHLRV